MENKFDSDFKCHPLTKEQQDEAFRAFDRQQQKSLERLVQMIESDPVLRTQHEAARRYDHEQKFGSLDFSKLEDRVMANAVMGRMSSPRSNIEHISPTLRHTSGKTRGVVQRRLFAADNLPRDGRIKVDPAPGKRMIQTDTHMGDVRTCDLGDAIAAVAYGLSGEQLGVIPSESAKGPVCPVGPSPSGRELRVEYTAQGGKWSAERRDRAATSAPERKKLRARTRAQRKARRKHR